MVKCLNIGKNIGKQIYRSISIILSCYCFGGSKAAIVSISTLGLGVQGYTVMSEKFQFDSH